MTRQLWFGAVVAGLVGVAAASGTPRAKPTVSEAQALPQPAGEVAVFSGGCFWGVQAVFEHVKGVLSAESGYTGGTAATAHYETVSGGDTGHAESVKVVFDPSKVSYQQLLAVFFGVVHDPTELNRQGPDVGTQYRSAIWFTTPAQQQAAAAYIAQLGKSGRFHQPIVTTVEPLKGFYPAESYHQDYYIRHPDSPYIMYNDVPKVKALEKEFPSLWREKPVMVADLGRAP